MVKITQKDDGALTIEVASGSNKGKKTTWTRQ